MDVKDLQLIVVIISRRSNAIRQAQTRIVSGILILRHVLISVVIKLNNLVLIVLILLVMV